MYVSSPCLPAGRLARWFVLVFCFLLLSFYAIAKEKKSNGVSLDGDRFFAEGRFEEAAKWYLDFATKHADSEKESAPALIRLGTSLEKMSDIINTSAERRCFRSPGRIKGTPCMKAYADELNAIYGTGAFEYLENMVFIRYTGAHYKIVAEKFPKGNFAPEAAYLNLSKNLVGHPDEVMPKVKVFLAKYPDGSWGLRGLLLWARLNEDVWWIHRKWSWVLYNWQVAPEDLIVKAEPYRQESLKVFQELFTKHAQTEEGRIAKREYELLKSYQDDGQLYGIVNESDIKGTRAVPGHELVE